MMTIFVLIKRTVSCTMISRAKNSCIDMPPQGEMGENEMVNLNDWRTAQVLIYMQFTGLKISQLHGFKIVVIRL